MKKPIPFTEFQLDRIKRFFVAVTALSAKPEIRLNTKQAEKALKLIMDPIETPVETLPVVAILDAQIDLFIFLTAYRVRDRNCLTLFQFLLVIAVGIGGYAIYQKGLLLGLAVLISAFVAAFILNLVVTMFYVARGFSPLKYGLTHTEVYFALEEIIGDPRWQRDIEIIEKSGVA